MRYLPHRYDTIIVALTLTFVGFIPLFHSAEADPLRWWPPHGGWQVGLMQSDVYSAMFCTMNNARTIQGKLQGDGLSTLKGQLNITSFDEKADPQTNTALTVDIDGRLFGSFPSHRSSRKSKCFTYDHGKDTGSARESLILGNSRWQRDGCASVHVLTPF